MYNFVGDIMDLEKELDSITKDYELVKLDNGLLIENKNINILNKYDINVNNYSNLNSLIFEIERILNEYELDDYEYDELDNVCKSLQEKNYYLNTNK